MAFVAVEDLTGHAEVTFFPRAYAEARELLKSEQPLCLVGKIDAQLDSGDEMDGDEEASREVKMLGQSVRLLAEACRESDRPIGISVPAGRLGREDMLALRNIIQAHPGPVEAYLNVLLDDCECRIRLGANFTVTPGPDLDRAIAAWAS